MNASQNLTPPGPAVSVRLLRRRQRQRLRFGLRRNDRSLPLALVENHLVALQRDFADAGHGGAGAGRNQTADDDVLLQALERIDLAVDRRLGEDAGGLLERGRREERPGLQARL